MTPDMAIRLVEENMAAGNKAVVAKMISVGRENPQ
jgi:hypothetical protein